MNDDRERGARWSQATTWHVLLVAATHIDRLGHDVLANTLRRHDLAAKMATTVNHIAHKRFMPDIGTGWIELEHHAFGLDFGWGPANGSADSMSRSRSCDRSWPAEP